MSDLFHEGLSFKTIMRVFEVMNAAQQHRYQILTKRAERLREFSEWYAMQTTDPIGRHIDLGVSVENQDTADKRIPELLRSITTGKRFVSYEPALGPVKFKFMRCRCPQCKLPEFFSDNPLGSFKSGIPLVDEARRSVWCPGCGFTYDDMALINLVIVGGESGPRARPFDIAWARSTIAQCKAAGVACFVKQLGAVPICAPDAALGKTVDDRFVVGRCAGINGNFVTLCLDDRKGGDMSEWPSDLAIREFPQ